MDRDGVEVHKHAKKEQGQYPAVLTEQAWSIKDSLFIYHEKDHLQIYGFQINILRFLKYDSFELTFEKLLKSGKLETHMAAESTCRS